MDEMKLNRLNLKIKEHLSNCSKNIELFLSFWEKNKIKDMNKKLEYLKKELDTIQKLIFDPKILSEAIYEQIVELELIKIFVSYCSLQEESLIILFLPFIQTYLFPNSNLLRKHQNDDLYELLLMNSSTLNSIKILNSTLIKVLRKTNTPEIIVELGINFLDQLLKKFVIFPNFYYSISSPNTNDSEFTFDAELFELVVELFSKEFFLIHRETRSKLRKAILLCLNLENFYSIKKQYIFNLFNYFVDNLIRYYQNYKSFELDNFKKAYMKKESITLEDMEEIYKLDVISYLNFINIFIRCLEDSNLKYIIKAKLFNKFFIEFIQKDLITFQKLFNPFTDKKLIKVMEFIFLLTKYLTNSTISELIFYFIFGFENVNKEKDFIPEELGNTDYLDFEKSVLITFSEDHSILDDLDFHSIKMNLQKLDDKLYLERNNLGLLSSSIINNTKNDNRHESGEDFSKNLASAEADNDKFNNKNENVAAAACEIITNDDKNNNKKAAAYRIFQLDTSSYDNEAILGFFIKVLKSESVEEMLNFKITLLNILIKIVKNCSGLFLIEVLIPFYINYIHLNSPKFFDGFLDKLVKYNEKFVISEIIAILLPKYFSMNFSQWESYFSSALQNNYRRNSDLLEKESILSEKNILDNLDKLNSNIFNTENSMDLNITRNHAKQNYSSSANNSNDSNFLDNEDILDLNNNINNATQNNKFSFFLNANESRTAFYETLLNYFKRFTANDYKENLFLTELFLEIFSVPLISNLGENGSKIYNIYQNITYYSVKKHFLYNISAIGVLGNIGNTIDENMRFNFNIDENNNPNNLYNQKNDNKNRNHQKSNSAGGSDKANKNLNKSTSYNTTAAYFQKNEPNFAQFLDNANLYIETFKEFVSNLYCKRYFDMINLNNLNQANR